MTLLELSLFMLLSLISVGGMPSVLPERSATRWT